MSSSINDEEFTPLMLAIRSGDTDEVKRLIESGDRTEILYHLNNKGETVLFLAIRNKNFKIVKMLVEYGANYYEKNNNGYNAVQIAILNNENKIVDYLVEKGVKDAQSMYKRPRISQVSKVSNLFFIDWDDTLFPTSYLTSTFTYKNIIDKNFKMDESTINSLKILENEIINLFSVISQYRAQICIITNGKKDWVQYTSMLYYPKFLPFLSQLQVVSINKLCIVSARHIYEKVHKDDQSMWKFEAFKSVANHYIESNDIQNIFSIGDSIAEKYAAKFLNADLKMNNVIRTEFYVKTIQLLPKPSISALIDEIKRINVKLPTVINKKENLDIVLKPNEEDW